MFSLTNSFLYCILDLGYVTEENAESVTDCLLKGGADVLQLRAKQQDLVTIKRVAYRLLPLCQAAGVPFILNDFPALAAEIDADGVHIGQDDGSLVDARKIMGPDKLVGRSTHSLEQARAALTEGFDYIGFGPLFPTPTKLGRRAIGLGDIIEMQHDIESKIPAFCIGGITQETLSQVLAAGADRVVIVSSLLQARDIVAATKDCREKLTIAKN